MNKYPTMDEVARLAGVSQATVSRVMRGLPIVSDRTRTAVVDAAEKLGFSRNMAASKLASNSSNEIGIIIPDIVNPFYAALYKGIESVVVAKGFVIMLGNAGDDNSSARLYLDKIIEHRSAGVIIAGVLVDPPLISEIKDKLHIVTISLEVGVDCVTSDEVSGAATAIDSLVHHFGHRRIAFWGISRNFQLIQKRFNGYLKGLENSSLPFDQDLVFTSGIYQEDIIRGVNELLPKIMAPNGPTAIFAFNDNAAVSIIAGLKQHGIRVPNDISVVGFDNTFVSTITSPTLTTVSQPVFEIGQAAARLLLERLKYGEREVQLVTLPTEFIIRESVRSLF